jgi:Uma2 family endonuclease
MALKAKKQKFYTPEEYLALEEKAEFRSEFDGSEIVAMAGGSLNHARIVRNIDRAFGRHLKDGCESLTSDVKVHVESYQKFYYPDVLVICGKPKFYEKRNDTIENPKLLVEVLSKSTEAKDRGEKFFAYQKLESVEEYVLVSQDKHLVEKFTKQDDGSWKYLATIGIESEIYFESVEETMKLSEIYDLVEFESK